MNSSGHGTGTVFNCVHSFVGKVHMGLETAGFNNSDLDFSSSVCR